MDWRQFLAPILYSSAYVFVLSMVDFSSGKTQPFGTHPFITYLILVVGMSIGIVGFDELKRGGHRKVRRNLLVCLTILTIFLIILALTRIHMHWKITGMDFADVYWFIPIYVLTVATFPIALYLNRKQKEISSQPTITDAS